MVVLAVISRGLEITFSEQKVSPYSSWRKIKSLVSRLRLTMPDLWPGHVFKGCLRAGSVINACRAQKN